MTLKTFPIFTVYILNLTKSRIDDRLFDEFSSRGADTVVSLQQWKFKIDLGLLTHRIFVERMMASTQMLWNFDADTFVIF